MILVVGGAGYIGSHFVKELVETHKVVVLDIYQLNSGIQLILGQCVSRVTLEMKKIKKPFFLHTKLTLSCILLLIVWLVNR